MNIIARHWRGDLSLPVSYWGVGLTVNVLFVALGALGLSLRQTINTLLAGRMRLSGAVILLSFAIVIFLYVWQFVGIWRSAVKHPARGGSSKWAAVAKAMVILGSLKFAVTLQQQWPVLNEGFKLLRGLDDIPAFAIRILRDGNEIELAGGMPFGTAAAFQQSLAQNPHITTVHLNNIGGRLVEGETIANLVRAHRLDTYVATACDSACTLVFLAGQNRYLKKDAKIGFHSASFGGVSGPQLPDQNIEFRDALAQTGASQSFIQQALATNPKTLWFPTAQELLDNHIVTEIVDGSNLALSGIGNPDNPSEFERELLKVPLYAALRDHAPQDWKVLREHLLASIRQGRSATEMSAEVTQALQQQILPKLFREGRYGALATYWQTQLDEMKTLNAIDSRDCAAFLFPEMSSTPLNLEQLLSADLRAADAQALQNLIVSLDALPDAPVTQDAVQADMRAVFQNVINARPQRKEVLKDMNAFRNDPELLCDTTIALYEEVFKLPSLQRRGAVLKALLNAQ